MARSGVVGLLAVLGLAMFASPAQAISDSRSWGAGTLVVNGWGGTEVDYALTANDKVQDGWCVRTYARAHAWEGNVLDSDSVTDCSHDGRSAIRYAEMLGGAIQIYSVSMRFCKYQSSGATTGCTGWLYDYR